MQIIKRKEKIGNILFTLGIILELLIMVTDHSAITLPLRGRIVQVAFVLFGCKVLTTDYTKKQWIFTILFCILGCISYFTCDDEYIIRVVVFIVATKNIDFKNIVRLIFLGTLAGTVLIIVLSLAKVMGPLVDVRDFGRGVIESRYSLGFSHANNLHDMFWYLTVWYFITNEKLKGKDFIFLTIANFLLYYLTVSRNGLLATQLLIIAAVIFHYFPSFNCKKTPYILGFLGLTASIFLTILAGLYGIERNRVVAFFDRFLTYRLEMVWEYAPVSSWSFFPGPRSLSYVDNGFASMFYYYGIIVTLCYLICIVYFMHCLYKQYNGLVLAILVTVIFVTFMETTFIFNTSLLCNPIYLLVFYVWNRNGRNSAEMEREVE